MVGQLISSEASPQSLSLSHLQVASIQRPLPHFHSVVASQVQESSSDPSSQSSSPGGVNTTSVTAFPLSGGITSARKLIRSIVTVIVAITHPSFVNAFGTVSAFVLKVIAVTSAVPLIPVVTAVVVSITNPGGLDTQVVVTLDLSRGAIHFVAVLLISIVTTVVVTITLEFFRYTFAVSAFQLVGTRTVTGAVGLVRSI